MTQYLTREALRERLQLAERDEESPVLGGTVRLRELTRAAFRDAARWAMSSDLADRERVRGATLVTAIETALDAGDTVAMRHALLAYSLPEQATDVDRWHAALLAASWIDPATGATMVERQDVLAWPNRVDLRGEVYRLAQAALDLSEVGGDHLKPESEASSPATE